MENGIYDFNEVEELLEADEIDDWEAGFMYGFLEA